MSKQPKKPVSPGRRQFFRDMFVHAIEGAETVGRSFADRHRFPYPLEEEAEHRAADYSRLFNPHEEVYGPPWPPRLGPDVPESIRAERRRRQSRTVARE